MSICTEILRLGSLGVTVEDETESVVCGKPATWRAASPGTRWRYRCDEHVKPFREMADHGLFPFVVVEPVTA